MPRFLTKRLILAIHRDQVESFGGSLGVRNDEALESALAQPEATFGGKLLHSSIEEQAAAYLFHFVQGHPFVDGNKRVGLAAVDTFLRINRATLDLDDDALYQLVMGIASGELDKGAVTKQLQGSITYATDF